MKSKVTMEPQAFTESASAGPGAGAATASWPGQPALVVVPRTPLVMATVRARSVIFFSSERKRR